MLNLLAKVNGLLQYYKMMQALLFWTCCPSITEAGTVLPRRLEGFFTRERRRGAGTGVLRSSVMDLSANNITL